MSAIAQRRAAAVTALIAVVGMLFAALPVAAQVEDENPVMATVETGCIPVEGTTADVVVTIETGFRVYIIDSDNVIIERIEAPGETVALIAGDYTWFAYDITDPRKTPLVDGAFTIGTCPPGDADVTVDYGCSEQDTFEVTFSTVNATISWTVDGEPTAVTSGQSFEPGTAVSWEATPDEGYVFDEADDVEGSFAAVSCTETTTPTSPPRRNPTTTAPPVVAAATVVGTCVTDDAGRGSATLTVNVFPAGGAVVAIDGVGTFSTDAVVTDLPDDTTYDFTIEPLGGGLVTATAGSVDVPPCDVEVLGTVVTTTVPAVSASTLPFTGPRSQAALLSGVIALVSGLGLLVLGRRRESEVASQPFAGWRNH